MLIDSETVAGRGALPSPWLRLLIVAAWAVAFAFVEAMVVFYIRRLFAIEFDLTLTEYARSSFHFPPDYLWQERAREAATMVMLLAAALLAGRSWPQRLAYWLAAFGIWDIFYYVWLYVLAGWPTSLTDQDLLFLIPGEWWGPVWEPVLVSCGFIIAALLVLIREGRAAARGAGQVT